MYIGPKTPRGTNKNPNRVPDLLTKVLPKAASGLARSALARRSGNETIDLYKRSVYKIWSISKNYIRQKYKIYSNILKSFYGKIRN